MQAYSQVDNYAKNTAIANQLEEKYKAELKAMPNSAIPHWNHANELSKLTFRASENAPEFYVRALKIDSTNTDLYLDAGNYFMNIEDYQSAYYCFSKGAALDSTLSVFIKGINKIDEIYAQKRLYWELHELPELDPAMVDNSDMSFEELTDYGTLFEKTRKGKFDYAKLVGRLRNTPKSLSPKEAFFLLLGQTQQEFYKPYNYDDEQKMQALTKEDKIDEALAFGEDLVRKEATNILVLRELLYCYRVKEDDEKIKRTEVQLQKLFGGMLYSGDGSCERPIVTLSVQEEYPTAIYMGFKTKASPSTVTDCGTPNVDKMPVVKDGLEGYLHFNYSPIFIWATSAIKD